MYDYVMVFPMEGPAGQMKQSATAKFSVQEMHKAGLETFSYLSVQNDELIVLVRCPVSPSNTKCVLKTLTFCYLCSNVV